MNKKILREIEEVFEDWGGVTLSDSESFFTAERLKWDKERGLLVDWGNLDSDIYDDVVEARERLLEKWEEKIFELVKKYDLSIEELNEYFERLWK